MPLLVRPNGEENVFEIVAGRRRYFASKEVEKETGEARTLPCRVLAAGDDAAAVEASLIENVARLDPDEMQQFEAFKALADKGCGIEEIANVFGVTQLTVRRRLALANLIPAIRKAYAEERLDGASVMALTLASEKQRRGIGMEQKMKSAPTTEGRSEPDRAGSIGDPVGRLLKINDVCKDVGLSRAMIYRSIKRNDRPFPRPGKIGYASRWRQTDIIAWKNALADAER